MNHVLVFYFKLSFRFPGLIGTEMADSCWNNWFEMGNQKTETNWKLLCLDSNDFEEDFLLRYDFVESHHIS